MDFSSLGDGITAFIVFLGLSSPLLIIGLIYYFKKRLEHKQILAAIEKGLPLADIMPVKKRGPAWIRNLTKGIAFIIIGGALLALGETSSVSGSSILIPVVLLAIGVAFFIAGLLQKKYAPSIDGNGNGGNNNSSSPAAVENQ